MVLVRCYGRYMKSGCSVKLQGGSLLVEDGSMVVVIL